MKKTIILFWTLFIVVNLEAQINMNDSTAQVIAYWNLNDKQTYQVTTEKYKIVDSDTTVTEYFKYMVDITVKDSTSNSYTIDWFYHAYEINEENDMNFDESFLKDFEKGSDFKNFYPEFNLKNFIKLI